jgi:hypothetical protein
MGRAATSLSVLVCAGLVALPAQARPPLATAELDQERDRLLARILEGEDLEADVLRFKALVEQRDVQVPTSFAALRAHRQAQAARRAWLERWQMTADAEVAWRCRLSVDPARPQKTDGWRGDWGQVVKKEQVRLAPRNALDEGELWTLYEVKGQARTYRFNAARFGLSRKAAFEAEEGELVLVCDGGTTRESRLPAPWSEQLQRSGFAVRVSAPPAIVKKGRWNPIHITNNALFWAVKNVRWDFPADAFVLSVIDITEDLGAGRYLIDTLQGITFILEVPGHVRNRALMVPGQKVWAVMGEHRFDRELKALVLVAQDLEPRYVFEPASPEDL